LKKAYWYSIPLQINVRLLYARNTGEDEGVLGIKKPPRIVWGRIV